MSLGVELKRDPNDLPANTARAPPISLHLFTIPLIRFLSNGGSHCVVSQCHLTTHCKHLSPRIYISCYYLLGLGLRAVSLGVLDFYRHELSVEKDQVVIMVVHGGVLTAGVLYTSVPSGSKSGVVSKMKNTL